MPAILVDADACPVKQEIIQAAQEAGARVVMVAALQHAPREAFQNGLIGQGAPEPHDGPAEHGGEGEGGKVEYVIVERHTEAVDIAIMNRTRPGDIVVTQDFGLAAVVVQKGGRAVSPEGRIYRADDLDSMLERRHHTRQLRRQPGGVRRLGRKPPFSAENRERFLATLRRLLQESGDA